MGNEIVKRNADGNDPLSLLKDLNVWQIKLGQAMRRIVPHIESENEVIHKSAASIYLVYLSIQETSESQQKLFEELIAAQYGETPQRPLSEITSEFAENQAKNEEYWRGLVPAVIFATYSLIELHKGDAEIRPMTITRKERDSLKSDLLIGFGDEIIEGPKAGQYPLVASAASLWKVLNDGWKSADE